MSDVFYLTRRNYTAQQLKAIPGEKKENKEYIYMGRELLLLLLLLLVLHCPLGEFGSPYLGKAQQPQEQRYPFLSVCAVFSCPVNSIIMAASV